MKNILKPLAKSVLKPLRLRAASVIDAAIHKKLFRSDVATLIISNGKWMILLKSLNILKNLVY